MGIDIKRDAIPAVEISNSLHHTPEKNRRQRRMEQRKWYIPSLTIFDQEEALKTKTQKLIWRAQRMTDTSRK